MTIKLPSGEHVELGQGYKKVRVGGLRSGDEWYHPETKTWRPVPAGAKNVYTLVRRVGMELGALPLGWDD